MSINSLVKRNHFGKPILISNKIKNQFMKCFQCDAEASHSTSEASDDGTSKTWYYCRDHEDPLRQ